LPSELKCPRCQQVISPQDTVESDGYRVAHIDCSRPRTLSPEEIILLYFYCWDHEVAECAACGQSLRQEEHRSDPFGSCIYGCLHCGADLTESIRAHLTACAKVPDELRRRVRNAREIAQRLLQLSHQLSDCADVLTCEAEAALAKLNETR